MQIEINFHHFSEHSTVSSNYNCDSAKHILRGNRQKGLLSTSLPDEPLQLRLGQVIPVEGEGVRDLQRLVVLDLELYLGGNSIEICLA